MKIKDLLFCRTSMFVIYFLFLISFCYIDFLSPLNKGLNYVLYGMSFIMMIFFVLDNKKDLFMCILLIFFVACFISTCINENARIYLFIQNYLKIIGFCIYTYKSIKIDSKNTIFSLSVVLYILIILNFLSIIIFPNGMYATERYTNNWFFKYDNTHIFMYFPALLVGYLNMKYNNKKIDFLYVSIFIIIAFCIFFCKSANSIVTFSIFTVYLIFKNRLNRIKWLNSRTFMYVLVGIFLAFVIFRIQDYFEWFIVGILHKNLTFSHRTYIWDIVIKYIKNSPILGYGVEDSKFVAIKFGNANFTHAHNTFLDIMYKGGIVSLIPFLLCIIMSINELYKNKRSYISTLFSVGLFCCLIMTIFEAREDKIGFYIVLLLCYYLKNIEDNIKFMNKNEGVNSNEQS